MSDPVERQSRQHRTLSDVYSERDLTNGQARRIIALLGLAKQRGKPPVTDGRKAA